MRPGVGWSALVVLAFALPCSAEDPVALVLEKTGELTVSGPAAGVAKPLRAFEWVAAGARIEASDGSEATVALVSGRRYRIDPRSRVRVGADSLETLSGSCRELSRLPTLPRLARILPEAQPGSRAGALRIRGRRIPDLYPDEATVLADSATLTFSPLPGIDQYQVEIEDEEGEIVFHASVRAGKVVVSPGVLRPGARYRWQVRGTSPEGPARGEAEFSVLDREAARDRRELRASLQGADDTASLALLAEVDRSLGLLREARETFSRALERSPGDADLSAAAGRLDVQMHPKHPPQ
jgi:hypothetical protein